MQLGVINALIGDTSLEGELGLLVTLIELVELRGSRNDIIVIQVSSSLHTVRGGLGDNGVFGLLLSLSLGISVDLLQTSPEAEFAMVVVSKKNNNNNVYQKECEEGSMIVQAI